MLLDAMPCVNRILHMWRIEIDIEYYIFMLLSICSSVCVKVCTMCSVRVCVENPSCCHPVNVTPDVASDVI